MPDLTGLPALDVLIGLAFLYFLLAVVCSSINEAIAATLAWRSKNLERAIRHLLGGKSASKLRKCGGDAEGDLTKRFFEHWRIRSLSRRPDAPFSQRRPFTGWRGPSYIPSRTFGLTVFDTLFPEAVKGQASGTDLIDQAKDSIEKIENKRVKDQLTAIVTAAGTDRDRLRAALETLFDDTMERASGWYKRKTQLALFFIALAVAVGANANSLHVAHRLWTDDALRAAVVAKAQDRVQSQVASTNAPAGQGGGSSATGGNASGASGQTPGAQPGNPYKQVASSVDAVKQLKLPLGWGLENRPPRSFGGVPGEIGGLILTIFALMLGAPFWFDVLGRAAALRNTGKPQPTGGTEEKDARVQPGVAA